MNYRYILSIVITSICLLSAPASYAARWFDVEVLIFKRNVDIKNLNEQLDQQDVYLEQKERFEVLKAEEATNCTAGPCLHKQNPVIIGSNQTATEGHRLKRLSTSQFRLTAQRKRLHQHGLFTPLMHATWRMPIENKQNAIPLHIFAGENYALDKYKNEINTQQQAVINTVGNDNAVKNPIQTDVLANLQQENAIQDLFEIDGNLLIYVEHYLHVGGQFIVRTETQETVSSNSPILASTDENESSNTVEIVDQEVVTPDVKTQTVITEALFDQKKRLKSGEIHYLDHPLFGIIIQIRKI